MVGREAAATAYETRRLALSRQVASTLVRESVVVGAPNSEALRQVERAALAALPADGGLTSWEVVKDATGRPREFNDKQAAHAAVSSAEHTVMGLEDTVRQLAVYERERGLPGFDQKTQPNFALDYDRPAGPTLSCTHLLDNLDNPDGTPRQLGPLEHSLADLTKPTLVVGAPGKGKTGLQEAMAAQAAALGIPVIVIEAGLPPQEAREREDYDNSWGQSLANHIAALTGDPRRSTVRVITP
ncbi:MAG TPA: hypothetical protein VLF67_02140, partial [Candidatus Saccharimonas sp.]|nr:hypothetical protein [Candidatus Saccharimonas sp.]